jgi:hypothetical protein
MQAFTLPAQSFTPADIYFPAAARGEIAWCDYDNDDDLDVFITGLGAGDEMISALYRNIGGSFVDCGLSFIPAEESMASWGDYDRDGDQDLLLAGHAAYGDIALIYRNEGGYFTPVDAGITGIQQGVVQWEDIDGDNDLDVFISGNWITEIYRNDDGIFTDTGAEFGYFSSSAASFGDYDNDGDLDLLVNGDSGAGAVSKIFINDEGQFSDAEVSFTGLMAGTADWVDYDNDGDLDAAISGFDDALEARFFLYKNQDKQFEIVYAGINGFAIGSADWSDYDNDGDADLVMSGKATGCGAYVSGIYRNDGNDLFYKISQEITTATRSAVGWSDYDNDGDPDFLLSGLNDADEPFTKLYLNNNGSNTYSVNSAPSAADLLEALADGNRVTLTWSEASDGETPVAGLTYNLRIGTFTGGNDVVPSMAGPETGVRYLTAAGNAGQCKSWSFLNLEPGTYYWSVQSVDQAYEASQFAPEESFSITATSVVEIEGNANLLNIYPNPACDELYINLDGSNSGECFISDLSGKVLFSEIVTGPLVNIDVKALNKGIYLVTIKQDGIQTSALFTK